MTGRPWAWHSSTMALTHGLEILPPVVRREEHVLAIGHVAPDDHAVEQPAGGLDLGLGQPQGELADPLDEAADLVGVEPDPEQDVLRADDAPEHLVRLADAAVDGEVRVERLHRLDPRRASCARSRRRRRRSGCRPALKIAPVVPGVVERGRPPSSRCVSVSNSRNAGMGSVELLPDHRLEAGPDDDLLVGSPRASRTAGCAGPCWAR